MFGSGFKCLTDATLEALSVQSGKIARSNALDGGVSRFVMQESHFAEGAAPAHGRYLHHFALDFGKHSDCAVENYIEFVTFLPESENKMLCLADLLFERQAYFGVDCLPVLFD